LRDVETTIAAICCLRPVYGANTKLPFSTRDNVDHPISLYAASKKANELMAHSYSHLYGIPSTGQRFFTAYGPWYRPDMALFVFAKVITEGQPIKIVQPRPDAPRFYLCR
jgi:UDP-glucuronate 4-epimerase